MRHTREFWLERLYARVPAFHREQDLAIARLRFPGLDDGQTLERAPLRSLLRTIAAQVAAVRQDLDDLWDDFFLETAEDWVVPYLGALVGTTLLPNPVGRSNRQDVRNTLAWRRAKGTPTMLAGLARGTTDWGAEVVEGFRTLAWTQHAAHVRLDRPLTVDLRDPVALARLGTAYDPFGHLPDFRTPGRSGATGQGGRYDLGTVVTFLRPLQTFPQRGVTPAATVPGKPAPAGARAHTFDPLHEELPLYGTDGLPVDPVAFAADPATAFGPERAFVVRRAGVPLALARGGGHGEPDAGGRGAGAATDAEPEEDFAFGAPDPATSLHPTEGMRVLDPTVFRRPAEHFTVSALWYPDAAPGPIAPVRLGAIATSLLPDTARAFRTDRPLGGAGRLVLRIETGLPDPLPGWAGLATADAGRFPACELAVRDDRPPRAARHGGVPSAAGRYAGAVTVHLPEVFVWPGRPVDLLVAADGSTYRVEPPADPAAGGPPVRGRLARASDGQAWPSAGVTRPVTWPYRADGGVHRVRGLVVADRTRFTGLPGLVVEVHELAAVPQLAGALVTADTPMTDEHRARLAVPPGLTDWPAFTFLPSRDAVADRIPVERTVLIALEIRRAAVPGPGEPPAVWPMSELVVTDRAGGALLTYLPEADLVADDGSGGPVARFALGADGSSWTMPGGMRPGAPGMLPPGSVPARAAQGQVLPLEGAVPLRRRRVVHGPARSGELGVDPARGVFCLAPDDPLVAVEPAERDLTVDYVEAFSGPVGARGVRTAPTAVGGGEAGAASTRIVSASGDAAVRLPFGRIHRTPAEAVAAADALWAATGAAVDEVIEIVDSASYAGSVALDFGRLGAAAARLRRHVTIRAGGPTGAARPCLVPDAPDTDAALVTVRGMTGLGTVQALSVDHALHLSGLLIGGRIRVTDGFLTALRLDTCTLHPPSDGPADGPAGATALRWDDADPDHQAELAFTASILAGIRTGPGVALVTGTDSVLHRSAGQRPGLALGGPDVPGRTRAAEAADPASDSPARRVRLHRVTVLGRLRTEELEADEALLVGAAVADTRQSGCLRFSRVEPGSVLPSRHRCVPGDDDLARGDTAAASFGSLRPRSALFAALGDASSPLVLTASGTGDEVGAFAAGHSGLRRANLAAKLAEFLPAGLRPVIVVEDGACARPPGTV
ncbi:hypothetical protein [Kitasatospora sp. NPDC050463]|uniref:hypothetical protein n=1 Tax=Kitasatospora sp. NPDC050463 TaxID=3155786 RepID=UPI0033E272EE